MAYIAGDLTLLSTANGYKTWRYDTLDSHATVDTDGYFNNSDDSLNITVGDLMDVIVWGTTVRSGTVSTYGQHVVMTVTGAGVVGTSDVTVGVVTDND